MPIVSTIDYPLTAAQNGKRVRLQVNGTIPVVVQVGDPNETWPEGCVIEIVRIGASPAVTIVAYDVSVTLNQLGGLNLLEDGEYARVSLVSPGVWDMHVYKLPVAAAPQDRLIIVDTEFTDVFDNIGDGSFADDVSVLTLGNGLRIRDTADKGGTAGKYVIMSPAIRTRRFLFDNAPLVMAVALYHLDSFTPSGADFTVPSTIGTGLVFVPDYEIGISISTAVTQFPGGGSLEMDGGTTGDSYITPTVETSDKWTFEFSTSWPTGAGSGSGCTAMRISGGPDISFETDSPSLYVLNFGGSQAQTSYGAWTQWAIVHDIPTNNLKLFKDGVKFYDGPAGGWPNTAYQFAVGLGRGGWNYNYGFPVYIDEIRISNSLLYSADYTPSATPFLP